MTSTNEVMKEEDEEEIYFQDMTQRPLVICGQPCTGKTTLINRLISEYPRAFVHAPLSARNPRSDEPGGYDYNINFQNAIRDVTSRGQVCVLEIDIQDVDKLKKSDLDPIFFFIKVPSLEEFEKRLRKRATDSEETIQNILSQYHEYKNLNSKRFRYENKQRKFVYFDFVLEHANLDSAYGDLKSELFVFFREYELYEDLSSDAYRILAKELIKVLGSKTLGSHQFDFGWSSSEWVVNRAIEALERVRNLTFNALCEPFKQAKACKIVNYGDDEPGICGNMAWTSIKVDSGRREMNMCNRHLRELVYDDKKSISNDHLHDMACQCRCCR